MKTRIACIVLISLGLATEASAQYINSGPGNAVHAAPQGSFNEQSLTTNRRDISLYAGPFANPKFGTGGDTGLVVAHPAGGDVFWGFEAGMAYGIARGFEAGFFLPGLALSPEVNVGDYLPLFITWAGSAQDVDFGLRNTLSVPLDGGPVRWNPGVHGLMRLRSARIDFGAFFPIAFTQPAVAGMDIPVRLAFGFEEVVFVSVQFGLRKGDLAHGQHDLFMPLGFGLLYSAEVGEHRLDIGGRFEWPTFLWATPVEGAPDIVSENYWVVWFGGVAHFDIAN